MIEGIVFAAIMSVVFGTALWALEIAFDKIWWHCRKNREDTDVK